MTNNYPQNTKYEVNLLKMRTRISFMRAKFGLSQKGLAERLTELCPTTPVTPMAVSQWENGRRCPNINSLETMAGLFEVPVEYICGTVDDIAYDGVNPDDQRSFSKQKYESRELSEIRRDELQEYDREPIFLHFHGLSAEDRWTILDYEAGKLISPGGDFSIEDPAIESFHVHHHGTNYYGSIYGNFPLTMSNLMRLNMVYVELIGKNKYMANQYNGWYRHNENRTCLVNAVGLMLPYDGLGISYQAFSKVTANPDNTSY